MLTVRASLLQLRLSKVSELIHTSTNHKDLDSASVMVHFVRIIDLVRQAPKAVHSYADTTCLPYLLSVHKADRRCGCLTPLKLCTARSRLLLAASQDDDTSEKVADSEFVVGRVAHRNNTSDYLIDGRKQTAKVVVERLKQEGIDLNHNRFLILQVDSHLQGTVQLKEPMEICMLFEQVLLLCKPLPAYALS